MGCGLLGRKLGHSYSPQIHKYFADYSYELFEKEPEELAAFLKNGDFTGLNVTMPYKKDVAALCDVLTERAAELGSVNTVVRRADGCLVGHNTDYFGFLSLIKSADIDPADKKVLVLGSGGASVTATAVLKKLGSNVVIISRTGENNYNNLQKHADASLIVNTTPVGMYPDVGTSPIDLDCFPRLEGVLDVVYNPARTKLLMDAEKRGLIAKNGLWMLVAQAKESAEWFSGNTISDHRIAEVYNLLRSQMENIILIGMPGCGKSTIGKLLATQLGREFIDTDVEIEARAGMTIPVIFDRFGERKFRELEQRVIAEVSKKSGLVIATGGGCVTNVDNYPSLHQNGRILWIKRNVDALPTEGRPLSQMNALAKLYQDRKPLYSAFSDALFENYGTVQQVLDSILASEVYQ